MTPSAQPAIALETKWKGRKPQISQLLRLLSIPGCHSMDVFVHGAPKSGKTSIVRSCLTHLGRQHAYCEVGETSKPKQLLNSILSQLHAAKRKRAQGYAGSTADNVADFVHELARACPLTRSAAYVVLDGAHLLARSPVLAALLQARELAGANVAWILISSIPWSSQWFCEGVQPLVMAQVYFPAYTELEVRAILTAELQGSADDPTLMSQRQRDLVPDFVTSVVCTHFRPISCALTDLRAVAAYLWPHYLEPLQALDSRADADVGLLTRKLFAYIKGKWLTPTLDAMEPGMNHVSLIDMAVKRNAESAGRKMQLGSDGGCCSQYSQEWGALPLAAKLLLVAAFIASRNKASHDKSVFDSKGRQGRVRGSKKAMESDRLAEAAKEARLKGPSPFSLERLLHIFHFLYLAADHNHSRVNGALRAQGLHVMKPSFVVDSATLTAMNRADRALGLTSQWESATDSLCERHEPLGGSYGAGGTQGAHQQLPSQQGVTRRGLQGGLEGSDTDDGAADAERFKQELRRAQGTQGRQRTQPGRRGARADTTVAGMQVPGGPPAPSAWGGGDGPRIEAAAATVPHPTSGAARCGSLPFSSDPAPVLQTIATLTSMGLIKRSPSEDILEAPRLMIAGVNESLATALAKDCGLILANYLMYA